MKNGKEVQNFKDNQTNRDKPHPITLADRPQYLKNN